MYLNKKIIYLVLEIWHHICMAFTPDLYNLHNILLKIYSAK